ncbi:hypothetical protein ACFW4K_02120 [Nocardiopsis alba]|uniref:hypothetical protein n=1 Tax=Nocardiopsis alba TaxID=53437 RepID=UPI00367023E8
MFFMVLLFSVLSVVEHFFGIGGLSAARTWLLVWIFFLVVLSYAHLKAKRSERDRERPGTRGPEDE